MKVPAAHNRHPFPFARTLGFLLLALGFCAPAQASSYIIVDNQSGYILDAKAANEKRQIASVTKMATACVVLDMVEMKQLNLNEMVSIPAGVVQIGGVNNTGFQAGDLMSVRDLLYCALLGSDNIAATALAHHAGGRLPNPQNLSQVANFVSHMNALARGLDMKRTLFLNPSGLDNYADSSPPYSTAADVARLVRYAYKEADFPFYVEQKSRVVHLFRAGQNLDVTINNTNPLLGQDGIDGVKTGRTARAGDCIVLSSEMQPEVRREGGTTFVTPRRIHVILLDSKDRASEGLALTRRGWQLYNQWAAQGRKTNRSKLL